jgi:cell division septation protein DedD
MTQTDGERELVLGNKQLISLFFVVVALCGVFFAMGYMIGRNTSKSIAANTETNSPTATAASPATESPVPQSQDSEPPRETAANEAQQPSTALNNQAGDTRPATAESASAPGTAVPGAPAQTPSTQAPPTQSPTIQTQAAHDTGFVPEPGATYLQVTALHRADADNLVKTLREQKLPALVADSSKPDLFRVLVGPYHQTADVADAKARLKTLGFANAFVQK